MNMKTALTSKEREIVQLLSEGLTIVQIAEDLGNSEHTIRNHVKHIHAKLDTYTLHQIVVCFYKGEINES